MLPLDNIIYKDYASWKIENHEFLETLQGNNSIIFERYESVLVVLDYVYDLVVDDKVIEDDLETIFEVGFNYLHTQVEVAKIYFEKLFQSNCEEFIEYNEHLLYLLYIYDIKVDIENNDISVETPELDELETNIENMIMERRKEDSYLRDKMNETLKIIFSKIGYEYVSIIDIFEEIAENLGIFIHEDKELIIGKDI